VIDDTQALGILGNGPCPERPYGRGGGGSARFHAMQDGRLLIIASLAKGFGVPVAMLAGPVAELRSFEKRSETRVHCGPPSAVALRALAHALTVNRARGEQLRMRLLRLVHIFRAGAESLGLHPCGGCFPVQALAPMPAERAAHLQDELARAGIRTVAQRHGRGQARTCFVFSARHTGAEVRQAMGALAMSRPLWST
jgi:8-amino-7-oxononanoate synthase